MLTQRTHNHRASLFTGYTTSTQSYPPICVRISHEKKFMNEKESEKKAELGGGRNRERG